MARCRLSPVATPSPVVTSAVSFLQARYDPVVGLLRESPILEAANRGDADEASRRYDAAMLMFNGVGFDDVATDTHYATYKLALAIIAGNRLDKPARPDLVDTDAADAHKRYTLLDEL